MSVTSHLVFDATDAASKAASANVGAYLRDAAGDLITSTLISGKQALDVNVANSLAIAVDLDHANDSVKVGDGTDFLAVNSDGSINITDNDGSITVDGTVAATQSGSWTVAATQSGSWTVTATATDLDIRDLAAASDSVSAWVKDGSGNSIGSTAGALNVNISSGSVTTSDAALANTAVANAAVSITTSAGDLVASPLSARKYLFCFNKGSKEVFIGTTGVTTSNGFPMYPGQAYEFRAGAALAMKAIAAAGTQDVRTLEFS